MILQLNPPIPVNTYKGPGLAWFLIDYGPEHNLMWTVAIDETGEIWTFQNPDIRAQKNITMGREDDKSNSQDDSTLVEDGSVKINYDPKAEYYCGL